MLPCRRPKDEGGATLRRGAVALALALLATGCFGSGGRQTRTILVDYTHDQFASLFFRYFPRNVEVHAGDELLFKQSWTGEPHTVTGGRLADAVGKLVVPLIAKGESLAAIDTSPSIQKAIGRVGVPFGEQGLNQTIAQPCYLRSGEPPTDGKPCRGQTQPDFDGRYSLYNSGLIPYQGPQGNEYRIRLAKDTAPGKYFFFCVTHGPGQSTLVEVKPRGEPIASAEATSRAARREIDRVANPLLAFDRKVGRKNAVVIAGHHLTGPFAGLFSPDVEAGVINEFVPKKLTVKAGEPITWRMLGPPHTISFDVPKYFPIVTFRKDGTVVRNPKLDEPAGGAPTPREPGPLPTTFKVDGGTYDGSGFWSSGSLVAQIWVDYTLRISRPGIYRFACLVHPPMVGKLVVT